MVATQLKSSGNLYTSTPLRCRHDSGFGSFEKYELPQEISPIRKYVGSVDTCTKDDLEKFFEIQGHCVNFTVEPRKLSFSNDSTFYVCHRFDSGYTSGQSDASQFSSKNKLDKKSECPTDENCNFTCTDNFTHQNKLHQPYKFICYDHSHEKEVKCSKKTEISQKFDSYLIIPALKKNIRLDVLSELHKRNCYGIISDILSFLSDCDLVRTSNVSKEWQEIVNCNKSAYKRRNVYINNRKNATCGPTKENRFKTESPSERGHTTAFTCVGNAITKQPLVSDTHLGRFDAFFQEIKLGKQALMKCPKCFYPATAVYGYKFCCTRKMCQHAFCKKCQGPYLDNHACTVPDFDKSQPNILICSKKSKKNLRRLRA